MRQLMNGNFFRSPLELKLYNAFEGWGLKPEVNKSIGSFEVDFVFDEEKLCIEVDGAEFHGENRRNYDKFRQKLIEERGYKFERFDGWFVWKQEDVIVAKIILKYLSKKVKKQTLKRAIWTLGNYFKRYDIDPELAKSLLTILKLPY